MEFNKKFLVVGNMNAITYNEVFHYIKNDQMWIDMFFKNTGMRFRVSDDYELNAARCGIDENGEKWISLRTVRWFTNIENSKRHISLDLFKRYNPIEYKKYDNYDAIECSKTRDIPNYYDGVFGVPITFLDKYCPDQFEILGCSNKFADCGKHIDGKGWTPIVNNKNIYKRIFIRHKR